MGIHTDSGIIPLGSEKSQKEIDLAYLREAYKIAAKYSDDTSTQTGAIIVKDNSVFDIGEENLLGYGVNSITRDVKKLPNRKQRPQKYNWIGHSERHAIYDAARKGNSTQGAIMYMPWFPCVPCADGIIESGIEEIVSHQKAIEWDKEKNYKSRMNWEDDFEITRKMFEEANQSRGFSYRFVEGDIGDVEILFKGKLRKP